MTKSISLSDDVYTLLKSIRGKDESFSEVIRRLTSNKGRLMEIVDLYPELSEVLEYEDLNSIVCATYTDHPLV